MHLLSKSRPHLDLTQPPRAGVTLTMVGTGGALQQTTRVLPTTSTITPVADPFLLIERLVELRDRVDYVVLSLDQIRADELVVIQTIKAFFPRVTIWLTGVAGRSAELAQAVLLGADGLVSEAGVYRFTDAGKAANIPGDTPTHWAELEGQTKPGAATTAADPSDPVLTADELRALLEGVDDELL